MQSQRTRYWKMPRANTVLEQIEEWRALDLRAASQAAINQVALRMRDKLKHFVASTSETIPSSLWRVRCDPPWNRESDLWEPPTHVAKLSRCNDAGAPVLYCSRKQATGFLESKAIVGTTALLIEYRAIAPLLLTRVVGPYNPIPINGAPVLSPNGLVSYRILREFIRSEFTKPVADETRFLYRLSLAMCQCWATSDNQDGWLYPSVQSTDAENVALHKDVAHVKLEVASAKTCVVENMDATELNGRLRLPGIRVRYTREAEVVGGELRWRDLPDVQKSLFFTFKRP